MNVSARSILEVIWGLSGLYCDVCNRIDNRIERKRGIYLSCLSHKDR